jgi:hypothetical protein
VSVQPYKDRDIVYGLEKFYFDFDSKEAPEKALNEALAFAKALKEYYGIEPFLKLLGRKGSHVDVFLTKVVPSSRSRTGRRKGVYERLQLKLLRGLRFETLDPLVGSRSHGTALPTDQYGRQTLGSQGPGPRVLQKAWT